MTEKLQELRKLLTEQGLDAYLQPVHDEWFNEYPPACNRCVEWLTGFSGSAGLVIVAIDKAVLLTDGRYTLQSRNQISNDYEVQNSGDISAREWLASNLPQGAKIGYDAKLWTQEMLDKLLPVIPVQTGILDSRLRGNDTNKTSLIAIENPIDVLWKNRPAQPATKVFEHELKYSGETAESKRLRIAKIIKKSGADACYLSSPESICWLLNIRARDTENTPLHLVHAIIDASGEVSLEIDFSKYNGKKMLFNPQSFSLWTEDLAKKAGVILQAGEDPCTLPKAIKNEVEITGIRECHKRDGVAVSKLLCWLSTQTQVSELEVVDKLLLFRKQNDLFVEPSFDTIAGSGANGAIVHYRATAESNRILQNGELFLLDSGGQYYDGTTDITRTIAIGMPNEEHKKRFTQVLKGHIALAMAKFPEGTRGSQLDVLARQFLWQDGVDYDHGTGHGVGCFLGVHEGPQRISKRGGDAPLLAGMVISNEPGFYKTGEYGIRIENLVTVVKYGEKSLAFDTLTCVPIDRKLVDVSLLSEAEKLWLNNYHAWVLAELLPFMKHNDQEYLNEQCAVI